MNKIIIAIDDKFFGLNKDLSISKIDNLLTVDFSDDILLFGSLKKDSIGFFEVHDITLHEKSLVKRSREAFSGQKTVMMKENVTDRVSGDKLILTYFANQSAFNEIFKKYTFKTIIPLDIILYRFNTEAVSIVSQELIYNKHFKSTSSFLPSIDSTLLEDRDPTEFINSVLLSDKYREMPKSIITVAKFKDSRSNNIKSITYNQLFKQIQNEKNFIMLDKVSLNYQAKNYKKILLALTLALLLITPYLFYQYISNKTFKNVYEESISTYSKDIKKIKKTISDGKTNIIYKEYKPLKMNSLIANTNQFSKYKGINNISFKSDNNEVIFNILIEGVENLKNFIKDFKPDYTIKKGKDFYLVAITRELKDD